MDAFDAALGAFLGAAVGDAAGAVLEFQGSITHDAVEAAMRMPGGGWLRVGPGQITDDTELAICLAHGLLHAAPPTFPRNEIAKSYIRWFSSNPFDIGGTTKVAMHTMDYLDHLPNLAEAAAEKIAPINKDSKANGALMRITPLAIWGHNLPDDLLARFAVEDSQLTHPNITCQEANAAYCIAISHLMRHRGDNSGAISTVGEWMEKSCRSEEVREWWAESAAATDGPGCKSMIGFVRWGFVHAFKHLRRGTAYEEAIRQMLRHGGDTDTNAAIVGGLIGALHGASSIPSYMQDPVVKRTVESEGPARPDFLQSRLIPQLAQELFKTGASYSGRSIS